MCPRFESITATAASEGRSSSRSLSVSDFTDHVPCGHPVVGGPSRRRPRSGISSSFLLFFELRASRFDPANQSLTLVASPQPARLVFILVVLVIIIIILGVVKENVDVVFVPSLVRRAAAAAVERILRRVRRPCPHLGWFHVPLSPRAIGRGGASSDGGGRGSRFAVLVHGADGETGAVKDGEHLLFRIAGPVDGIGSDDVLDTAGRRRNMNL